MPLGGVTSGVVGCERSSASNIRRHAETQRMNKLLDLIGFQFFLRGKGWTSGNVTDVLGTLNLFFEECQHLVAVALRLQEPQAKKVACTVPLLGLNASTHTSDMKREQCGNECWKWP